MTTPISRRHFVQTAAAAMAAAPAARLLGETPNPGRRKPNVILIVLDDLGSIDANCYGAKDLTTPNIDALAARGVRFTRCCSSAPLCSPSRASIMTGRYPQRAGLEGNASSEPGGAAGLGPDEITLAQVLKDAGYVTGHVGKWHLGYTPQTIPTAKGFDSSFGFMGGCIDNYSQFFYWSGPNRHDLWQNAQEIWREGQNIGDMSVEHCQSFIDDNKDKPFFLYWAINMPHYPLQGKAKWREHYKGLKSPRSMYAACVSTADELIGQVLSKVRALGLENDTIIALQSDHGHSTEIRTFGGGGDAGPFRGAKFSLFEGGIRVVSMIRWPGVVPAGAVREQFVSGCDWLATIAELTGAALPKRHLDGVSMTPIIHSPTAPSRHPEYHWRLGRQWAVRQENWKLIGNPVDSSHKAPITPDDKLFLCDLDKDISEMTNFAKDHPDVVRRLSGLHEQWTKEVLDRA